MKQNVRIHVDDDRTVIETIQDCTPILENNARLRTQEQRSDWGRHVASIPNVIMTKWLNEEWQNGNTTIRLMGDEMDRLVERKLKDPEWAYLRTDSSIVQGFMGFGS